MIKPNNYKPLISKPNLKHFKDIKKVRIYTLSIPDVKTCIGSTKKCRKLRMIKQGNFKRFKKGIQKGYEIRYKFSLQDDFVNRIDYELKTRKVKKEKIKFLRIHVSGDIYSQSYKDKLFAIMKKNPDVSFLIYSKSLCYDFADYRSLKNVGFIQSYDTRFKSRLDNKYSIATIYKSKSDIPKNSIDCSDSDLLAFQTARQNKPIALLLKGKIDITD